MTVVGLVASTVILFLAGLLTGEVFRKKPRWTHRDFSFLQSEVLQLRQEVYALRLERRDGPTPQGDPYRTPAMMVTYEPVPLPQVPPALGRLQVFKGTGTLNPEDFIAALDELEDRTARTRHVLEKLVEAFEAAAKENADLKARVTRLEAEKHVHHHTSMG